MTGDAPAAAVAALSAALGPDPGRGDLWGELATALVAAGRPREAWDAAVRAVELAPQSAASHRAIGTVAAALGDVRQAESAYRHALRLDPADHGTRTALSRLPTLTPPPAPTGRRRAADPGPAAPTGRRAADPGPGAPTGRRAADPGPGAPTGRRAADPGPGAPTGRRRASEPEAPSTAGRRRAPDPDEETAGAATGRWRVEVQPGGGGRRRAPEPAPAEVGARADAHGVPAPRTNGSRHAAADGTTGGRHGLADPAAGGRHGLADPTIGGRRRAPEPDPAIGGRRGAPEPDPVAEPAGGGGRWAPSSAVAEPAGGRRRAGERVGRGAEPRAGAVGLPGWLAPNDQLRPDPLTAAAVAPTGWPVGPAHDAPSGPPAGLPYEAPAGSPSGPPAGAPSGPPPAGPPHGAVGAAAVPVGATRVADPDAWRKALVAVIRIEWLVGVACFVGLAYGRTAPYTAGLLAGAIVVAGAYARLRWRGARTRRPPARDRIPTHAAVAAVAVAVLVVPAAMVGALTLARVAAVAAVTCATFAATLIGRDAG